MLKKIIVVMFLFPSFSMADHHGEGHDHKANRKAMKEMKREFKTACRDEMKLPSREDVKAGKATKPTRAQRKAMKKCVKAKFSEAGKEMPKGKKSKMKGKMNKAASAAGM